MTGSLPVWMPAEGRKPRLPKKLTWVVGVGLLSERFAYVPQRDDLQVWFNDHPMEKDYCLGMNQIISQGIPYQVLTVWYSTIGAPHWTFMVYPVETRVRSKVRSILKEEAFSVIEDWLSSKRTDTWLMKSKHLRCIYNQAEQIIEMKEDNS